MNQKRKQIPLNSSPFTSPDGPQNELILSSTHFPTSSINASNTHIISGDENGILTISQISNQTPLYSNQIYSGPITSISDVNNNLVIAGGFDGGISVANLTSNKIINSFNENKNAITHIVYNNPYNVFIASSLDGTLRVYNTLSNKSLSVIKEQYAITTLQWVNSLCVSGSQSGEITIYDINTKQVQYSKRLFPSNVSNIIFDMTSGTIISTCKVDGTLCCLDMRMKGTVFNSKVHKSGISFTGCISNNGLIVTTSDNLIKVHDIKSGFKDIGNMRTSEKIICGDIIEDMFTCVGCNDGTLLGFDLIAMKCCFGYACDEKGKVRKCKILNSSKAIAAGGDEGVIRQLLF